MPWRTGAQELVRNGEIPGRIDFLIGSRPAEGVDDRGVVDGTGVGAGQPGGIGGQALPVPIGNTVVGDAEAASEYQFGLRRTATMQSRG